MPDNKEFNKIKAVYGEDVVLLAKKPVPTPEPVVAFTLRTAAFELDQTPFETGLDKAMVFPTHKADGPAIGAFAGTASTFTVIGVEVAEHPFKLVTVTA